MGAGRCKCICNNTEFNLQISEIRGNRELKYTNGDRYQGEWINNGIYHGYGTLKRLNRYTYVGQFQQGRMHGNGEIQYQTGEIYQGRFMDDRYHGQGTLKRINQYTYIGQFRYGKMHGKGHIMYQCGQIYYGEFANGNYHGKGTLTYADGSTTQGKWYYGKRSGKFRIHFPDTESTEDYDNKHNFRSTRIYESSLSSANLYSEHNIHQKVYYGGTNGKFYHGRSKIIFLDSIYFVTYFKGKLNGYCVTVSKDGTIQKSQSVDNKFTQDYVLISKTSIIVGQKSDKMTKIHNISRNFEITYQMNLGQVSKGYLIQNNNDIYHGYSVQGVKQIQGTEKINSQIYTGDWLNENYHGKGTCLYRDGAMYSGEWVKGQKHGFGIFITLEGTIYEGQWIEDKRSEQ